jgi:hypothetical protein
MSDVRRGWIAPKGRRAIEPEAASLARQHPEIQPGVEVLVRTADDQWISKVTTTGIVAGYNFPVVWVESVQPDHEPVPWPAEDVRLRGQEDRP